jgi:hypothetical protein
MLPACSSGSNLAPNRVVIVAAAAAAAAAASGASSSRVERNFAGGMSKKT